MPSDSLRGPSTGWSAAAGSSARRGRSVGTDDATGVVVRSVAGEADDRPGVAGAEDAAVGEATELAAAGPAVAGAEGGAAVDARPGLVVPGVAGPGIWEGEAVGAVAVGGLVPADGSPPSQAAVSPRDRSTAAVIATDEVRTR